MVDRNSIKYIFKISVPIMKEFHADNYDDFIVISCSDKCNDCLFKCEVVVADMKQVNISTS